MKKKLSLLFILCTLIGCSIKPTYQAKHANNVDFFALSMYSLYDRNSVFSDYQNMSDTTRNSIEIAIEKAFDAQGWQYKSPDNAQVIVAYHLVDRLAELKKYNRGVKYCLPCLPVQVPEKQNRHQVMQPGTLILDMVDVNHNRTIWRGVSRLKINERDHSLEAQDKIEQAIIGLLDTVPK
ncbi:DUF4136 domain-containing protein [Thalassotalea sp. PP2-459]|uniref:DUF4136 domain-containing protein n=1 Tax=Thalassotalea sp. PP2-459 TaxID=1742724 RepID=UPI000944191C|nr:DUF4136 domain-containing protein [Thalassotalea sp. PP2-459]